MNKPHTTEILQDGSIKTIVYLNDLGDREVMYFNKISDYESYFNMRWNDDEIRQVV